MFKNCLNCGIVFDKKNNCSLKNWNERVKYCSKKCSDKFTLFKKGNIQNIPFEKRKRGPENNKWKGGPIEKICITCKKHFFVQKYRSRIAKTCSVNCSNKYRKTSEFRDNLHKVHKQRVFEGKHNLYRGISSLINILRHCSQYKQWRDKVFKRDEWTCQICLEVGRKLNADHIKQFALVLVENNIKTFEEACLCKELWDISNGRTLCYNCHIKTDTFARRLSIKN